MWAGGGATGVSCRLDSPPEMVRTSLPVRRSTRTTDSFPVSARGVNKDDDAEASAARMGEAASIAIAKQQIYTFLFAKKGPLFWRRRIATIFSWRPARDSSSPEAVVRSWDAIM